MSIFAQRLALILCILTGLATVAGLGAQPHTPEIDSMTWTAAICFTVSMIALRSWDAALFALAVISLGMHYFGAQLPLPTALDYTHDGKSGIALVVGAVSTVAFLFRLALRSNMFSARMSS